MQYDLNVIMNNSRIIDPKLEGKQFTMGARLFSRSPDPSMAFYKDPAETGSTRTLFYLVSERGILSLGFVSYDHNHLSHIQAANERIQTFRRDRQYSEAAKREASS